MQPSWQASIPSLLRPGSAPAPGEGRPPHKFRRPGSRSGAAAQGSPGRNFRHDSKSQKGTVGLTQINKLLEQCCIVDDRPAGSPRIDPAQVSPAVPQPEVPYDPDGECPCCKELLSGFERKLHDVTKVLRQDFASVVAKIKAEPDCQAQMAAELSSLRKEMHEFLAESKSPKRLDMNSKDIITEIRRSKSDVKPILERINSLANSVDQTSVLRRIDSLKIDEKVLAPVLTQNKEMLVTLLAQMDEISVDFSPVLNAIANIDVQQASSGSLNQALDEIKASIVRKEDLTPVLESVSNLAGTVASLQSSMANSTQTTLIQLQDQMSSVLQQVSTVHTDMQSKFESMATAQESERKWLEEKMQPMLNHIESQMVDIIEHQPGPQDDAPRKDSKDQRASLQTLTEQIYEQVSKLNASPGDGGNATLVIDKLNTLQDSFDLAPLLSKMTEVQTIVENMGTKSGFEQVLEALAGIDLYSIEQKVDETQELLKKLPNQSAQTPNTTMIDLGPMQEKIDGLCASSDKHFQTMEDTLKSILEKRKPSKEISLAGDALNAAANAATLGTSLDMDVLSQIQSQLVNLEDAVLAQANKGDITGGLDLGSIKDALQEVKPTVDFTEVLEEIQKIKLRGLNPDVVLERIEDLRLMQRAHTEKMDEQWFTPVMHKIQCINTAQNDVRNILFEKLEKSLDLSPVLDAIQSADNNGLARYNETSKEVRRVRIKDEDFKIVMENINAVKQKLDLNFKPLLHRIETLKLDPDFKPVLTRIEKMEKSVLAKQAEIDLSPVMAAIGALDVRGGHHELLEEIQKINFGAEDFKPILESVDALQRKFDFAPLLEQINGLKADDAVVKKLNAMQEDIVAQRDAMAAVDLSPVLKAIARIDIEGVKKQIKEVKSFVTPGTGQEGGLQNRGTAAAELTIWPALGYSVSKYSEP